MPRQAVSSESLKQTETLEQEEDRLKKYTEKKCSGVNMQEEIARQKSNLVKKFHRLGCRSILGITGNLTHAREHQVSQHQHMPPPIGSTSEIV
jgi:hypothetical protein